MARGLSRLWLWQVPAALATLAGAVFAGGLWLAIRGTVGAPLGEPPPTPVARAAAKPAGSRFVLVLGDSLSRGTGDPTGLGYAADVIASLKRRGRVESVNLAVGGAESGDLRRLVESANVRSLAATADFIVLSIGGNDLSHSLAGAGAPADALSAMASARTRFATNLRAILDGLRAANRTAPIRVLGLYQPFDGAGREARVGASFILSWNAVIGETALAYSDVQVIPVFDLFQARPDRLATDRFHPNRDGYKLIAERVIQTLAP
jgi:lysophospholipase L1-like esterase